MGRTVAAVPRQLWVKAIALLALDDTMTRARPRAEHRACQAAGLAWFDGRRGNSLEWTDMRQLGGGLGGSTARSRAVLALYLAFTLLVFSFILFEVLDVDASDFPPPSKATTSVKLAEPPHDLKRAMTGAVEGPLAPHSCASASERRQTPLSLRSPLAP